MFNSSTPEPIAQFYREGIQFKEAPITDLFHKKKHLIHFVDVVSCQAKKSPQ